MVSIIIAGSTAKFGSKLARAKAIQLFLQTIDKYHKLFTQPGGRCRLSVSFGQHGYIIPLVSVSLKLGNDLFYLWAEYIAKRILY